MLSFRGVYPKGGLGEQSPTFLKVGVDVLVILGLIVVVSCCIRHPSDAYSKQRLFEASVTVCLCKQHIAQYCGDSANCIIEYPNHTGPKSKIMPPFSAQTR